MAELWDLYDSSRKKTGVAVERGQTIPEGSYHLVVSVWIMNSKGEFLLSQRHPDKPSPIVLGMHRRLRPRQRKQPGGGSP